MPKTTERRKATLQARNDAIAKRFDKLYKQGFRTVSILERLEDEFFLSKNTLQAIICGSGVYKPKN